MTNTNASRQNWFPTLNAALAAEGLVELWPIGQNVNYGETVQFRADDGTRHGRLISVFRDTDGRYERPVHYAC